MKKHRLLCLLLCIAIALNSVTVTAFGGGDMIRYEPDFYEDGAITVSLNASPGTCALLCAAAYDGEGMMTDFDAKLCSGGEAVRLEVGKHYTYKVFALDPETKSPLCEAAELQNYSGFIEFQGSAEMPVLGSNVSKAASMMVGDYVNAKSLMQQIYELLEDEDAIQAFTTEGGGDSENPTVSEEDIAARQERQQAYDEACKLVDDAMAAWERVISSGAAASAVVKAENEALDSRIELMSAKVTLAGSTDEQLEWAQKITDSFDAKTGNNRIAQLAEDMGCDAKQAYNALCVAQAVLQGKYAGEEEALYDKWIKISTATKTASKVGLYVCTTIATAGTATAAAPVGYVTLGEAAGIVIGGVDCIIETTSTTAKVILGDEHAAVKAFDDKMSPITEALSIYGIVSGALSDGSLGENIAYYGDIAEKLGVYEYFSVLLNPDGSVTADVKAIDSENPEEAKKAAESLDILGGTPGSDPGKIMEDFSDDRKSTDEKLKDLLENEGIEEDLEDIRKEFDDDILDRDRPLIWDNKEKDYIYDEDIYYVHNYYGEEGYFRRDLITHEERRVGLWTMYDSSGLLQHEAYYNAAGKLEWYRGYNKGKLGSYTVYRDDSSGYEVKDVTTYYNPGNCSDPDVWGRVQSKYTQVNTTGSMYGKYIGRRLSYDENSVLLTYEEYDGNGICQHICEYDGSGLLSIEVIRDADGVNTNYSYYTANSSSYPGFEMIGHLQSITCTDNSSLVPKYTRREEWTVVWNGEEYEWKYTDWLKL